MTVGLIWAESRDGIIGSGGGIPWSISEDLARFRAVTLGHTVVMGRRTWDSLPPWQRPLTGRRNIVVTRQVEWEAPGAEVIHSVEDALAVAAGDPVWVIGGAQIFQDAIGLADTLEITQIRERFAGDTVAPRVGREWTPLTVGAGWRVSQTGMTYRFTTWRRRA